MDAELKRILVDLHQAVLDLFRVQDESALNEIALIATLKELVPGFGPKFDRLRSAAEKQIAAEDHARERATRAWLDKLN